MKFIKSSCLMVVTLLITVLSSCGSLRSDLSSLNSQEVADSKLKQITEAIESNDDDQLKSLFSANALKDSKDIDEKIDYLMQFYQGKITSQDGAVETSGSADHGEKQLKLNVIMKLKQMLIIT